MKRDLKLLGETKKIVLNYHKNKRKNEENSKESSSVSGLVVSLETQKNDSLNKSVLSTNFDVKSRNVLSELSLSSNVETIKSNSTIKNNKEEPSQTSTIKTVINTKPLIVKKKLNCIDRFYFRSEPLQ